MQRYGHIRLASEEMAKPSLQTQPLFLFSSLLICEICVICGKISPSPLSYSYRSATIGSTFIARRAGTRVASVATPTRSAEMPTKVTGSEGLMS